LLRKFRFSLSLILRVYFISAICLFASPATSIADDDPAQWDYIDIAFEIKGDDVYSRTHKKLTVFNVRGDDEADLYFSESNFASIKHLEIILRDASGNTIKNYKKKDLTKTCGFGAGYQVFNDVCYYSFEITAPRFPYSVEIFEEKKINTLFLFRGATFPTKTPITSVTCSLIVPTNLPLRFELYAVPLTLHETFSDKEHLLIWTGQDIPKIDEDTLDMVDWDWAGTLNIVIDEFKFIDSHYKGGSWSDIGRWYADVLRDRYNWNYIKPLNVQSTTTDNIYRASLDNITADYRYVSVSIGTSGWRPRKLDDITDTKYGDCKDLSMLLLSDLRNQNVETYPVLIRTRSEGMLDTTFPCFNFNHLISVIVTETDTIWMDPTCRSCPYGQIPWGDENTYALLVTDAGGTLVRTPQASAEKNRIVRLVKTKVDIKRRVHADVQFKYIGHFASYLRDVFSHKTGTELNQFIESILTGKSMKFKVKDFSIENADEIYQPLLVNISAISESSLKRIGNTIYFDPCIVEPDLGIDNEDYDRIRPIRFSFPRIIMDTVWVEVDSALPVENFALPIAEEITNEIGSWRVSPVDVMQEIGCIAMAYSLDNTVIYPEQFDQLQELSGIIESRDKRLVKINLK
jgi:hypothetical protein